MRLIMISLFLSLWACKEYVEKTSQVSSESAVPNETTLPCDASRTLYDLQKESFLKWSVVSPESETAKAPFALGSQNLATGELLFPKTGLSSVSGLINFDQKARTSANPIEDRLVKEVLYQNSESSPFRLSILKLFGDAKALAIGSSVMMKADSVLELGGMKGSLTLPLTLSESGGIISIKGGADLKARESRPGMNTIALDEKMKVMEGALGKQLGSILRIDLDLKLKSSCQSQ